MKPRLLAALFNLCCIAWPLSASALQIVDVADGVTAYAKIAADELTRLSIAEGRIASWYVPKGKLVIEKDAKGGQLYVRPLDRSAVVSMFITSGNGATYALTMQPLAMPSESVVLREGGPRKSLAAIDRAGSLVTSIKDLMLTMASDRIPLDTAVHESGQEFRLWQGSRLTLVRSWLGQTLMGERFDLTNTSSTPMHLLEQEFFKPGVLAISVETLNLAPGDTTRVFVVRHREGDL
ncbi:MAG: type-F conjugative transfer system secretin TraK [Thiobacillaceae bacterium]